MEGIGIFGYRASGVDMFLMDWNCQEEYIYTRT
jgi:hypothetical protein